MPPFRTLRRLLSRARQDWQEVVEGLFLAPTKPPRPRPLRVMRLERRRVLSADFSLTASSLLLDGFDQEGDSLAITQQGDAYLFTTDDGWNTSNEGALPTGVAVQGETLSVQRSLLDGLSDGLTVVGSGQSALNVTLGEADFSAAAGPLSIVSPTSLGQQPFSLFTAPSDGIRLGVASPGLTVSSLNIAGDLEVTSFGKITDADGTQIIVTGDATFISNAGSPDGDFNGDGRVDAIDRSNWTANYGLGQDASKYDGDANGDGVVNAVDYSLWRDSDGQTLSGGIELADDPGDRLEVGGTATFNAAVDGRHEISIGVPTLEGERSGWVELGAITVLGSNVEIIEDAPSDVARVEAYNFALTSSGKINVLPDAVVLVEDAASLTSLYVDYRADFDGDGVVDDADYSAWLAAYGTASGAARMNGDANGDGAVNAVDYAIWRDGFEAFDPDAEIEGGITVSDGARFEAGGLVTLLAGDSLTPPAGEDPSFERFDITVNDGATAVFGSLALDGRNIKVVEDAGAFKAARDGDQDGTVIAGINAEQLLLVSYGPITSTGTADIYVGGGNELLPNATFASTGSILLADMDGRNVQIDGEATFIAGADGLDTAASIRVGVDSDGSDSAAQFNADDGLRFSAPGDVRISEDSGTELLGWSTYVVDDCLPTTPDPLQQNMAASLELQSNGRIIDAQDAITSIVGNASFRVVANSLTGNVPAINLADRSLPSANRLLVGSYVTFVDSSDTGIEVGTDGDGSPGSQTFYAGKLRFSAGPNAAVIINEGSDSELGNWTNGPIDFFAGSQPDRSTAGALELLSRGSLTDETGAIVVVANDATFVAFGGDGASTTKAIELADDDTAASTDLLDIGGTATFVDAGAVDATAAGIDVGVAADGSPAEAAFVAGGVRFSSPNAIVRIAEDGSTLLEGWATANASVLSSASASMESVAAELEVWSAGFIADDAETTVRVTGDATLIANAADTDGDTIRLADGLLPNTFAVDGLATFIAGQDGDANTVIGGIAVGVTSGDATALATFAAGSLRFFAQGSDTRIAEDNSTVLAGWAGADLAALPADVTPAASEALLIEIFSAGSITDTTEDPIIGATDAVIFARGADESVPDLNATATFVATTEIVLADENAGNRLVVEGLATFIAGDASRIDVGVVSNNPAGPDEGVAALAEFNAVRVRFSAPNGTVRIAEDSGTDLAGWTGATIGVLGVEAPPESSQAATFELFANGALTDANDSQIAISGNATFVVSAVFDESTPAAIRLADSDSTDESEAPTNVLTVEGLTTLIVLPAAGSTPGIDVGVNATGQAARATFESGGLRFSATDRLVRLAEDDSTELATWSGASIDALGIIAEPVSSTAADLQLLTAGMLTDAADAVVNVTGAATLIALGSGEAIRLADGGGTNEFTVGGMATLISGPTAPTAVASGSILVGVSSAVGGAADATFDAGKLRFYAEGATVRVAEDSSTILTNWEADTLPALLPGPAPTKSLAQTLELSSTGSITDMQLAADDSLDVVVTITGLGGTTDPMANATFVAAEDIVLTDGGADNELVVDGMTTLVAGVNRAIDVGVMSLGEVQGDGSPADARFNTGTLRFGSSGGTVRIAEDSDTILTNWESDTISSLIGAAPTSNNAQTLEVLSAGSITDAKNKTDDATEVTIRISAPATEQATATFVATTNIALADAASSANLLSVGDLATFFAGNGKSIDIGVQTSGDDAGDAALAMFNAGSVRFSAPTGTVRIAEDSGTELAGWTDAEIDVLGSTPEPSSSSANRFELLSNGLITDAADADVMIDDGARFVVSANVEIADAVEGAIVQAIVLADNNDASTPNALMVGGLAEFIVEVPVTDGFDGPKGIDLGVQAGGTPANATFEAGSLRFSAPDASVRIAEDDGSLFANGVSDSRTLELLSTQSITDAANAALAIAGDATLVAGEAVALADTDSPGTSNALSVGGIATFIAGSGETIDVGVDADGSAAPAEFNAGSLRFSVPEGTVRIAEDSSTVLTNWETNTISPLALSPPTETTATTLELRSAGSITDAKNAAEDTTDVVVRITFPDSETESKDASATFIAATTITLADADSMKNLLLIDDHASFKAGNGQTIDVGIDPSNGTPAAAKFGAGSLQFTVIDGTVRIAEDDDTQIGASISQTGRLQLKAEGDITDEVGAETEITVFAELNAMNGAANIVLGDDSHFSMGTPTLFDESMYLAMDAFDLSVEVDSAVNLRTSFTSRPDADKYGLLDADFDGTYFLTATGSISQVGDENELASLTADKVSLASSAAIFMTGLVLNNKSEDEPNLQIKAEASRQLSTDLSVANGTIAERFSDRDIPTPDNATFAPIIVEIDNETTGKRGETVKDRDPDRDPETDGNDLGFQDLLVEIEETGPTDGSEDKGPQFRNARISETLPEALRADENIAEHQLYQADNPKEFRQIDDSYSAVVIVKGDAVVGDVKDAVGPMRETNDLEMGARGFEVTSFGNAYLHAEGDLVFTSAEREVHDDNSDVPPPLTGVVVGMGGGVFTAVADQELSIDTDDGSQGSTDGQTSLLRSVTGTVSSVGRSDKDVSDGDEGDANFLYGPRVFLDPSDQQPNAATTGLVRADTDFEQRITLAVGSRDENNVLVEVEWADVAKIRQDSAAKVLNVGEDITPRIDFDTSLPGSTEFADLTQASVDQIEPRVEVPDLVYQELGDEGPEGFRVATLRHNFDQRFVPSNPSQENLPTTVRVYNDPSINLYDQAGTRDLNSASFSFAPLIIAVEGGFFLPIESAPPQEVVTREVMVVAADPLTSEQPTNNDGGRAVVTSNAEILEYGRIDSNNEWIDDLPGEAWPQSQDDLEGDYLREVRDRIDNGAYSEGTYRIQIVTPRGEQVLEEWVKGDLGEEGDVREDEGFLGERADEAELLDTPPPVIQPEALPPADLIDPLSAVRATRFESNDVSNQAANAAFAAMAAVGGWRRRLGGTGAFKLDDDGVAFTRAKRRRRERLD